MDEIEIKCLDVERIVNTVFVELTRQMAAIEMRREERIQVFSTEKRCFGIRTEGAFLSFILFEIEEKVYEKIAAMLNKSGTLSIQEKKQSVVEYLNVICGRILSEINNRLGRRSKLSVPHSFESKADEHCFDNRLNMSYTCRDGTLNIIVYFDYK